MKVARQSQASADLPATETIPWCAKKSKGREAVEWLHPAIYGRSTVPDCKQFSTVDTLQDEIIRDTQSFEQHYGVG